MFKNADKGSIIRTAVLFLALINQFLVMNGIETLPFTGEELEGFLSGAFTFIAAVIAWWKNNFLSAKGQMQKEVLQKEGLTKAK